MIFRRRRKDDEIPADEAEDTTETDPSAGSADDTEPEARPTRSSRSPMTARPPMTASWTSTLWTRATGAVPDPGT